MKRAHRLLVHTATVLVGGSGVVYAVMLYLLQPVDPWAVVNHPWQPTVQHLHVLTAPMLVFACGLIWEHHVRAYLARGEARRRGSGVGLALSLLPMAASGYLLQVAVSPGWRRLWVGVHVASSALWLAAYAAHWLSSSRARARVGAVGDKR